MYIIMSVCMCVHVCLSDVSDMSISIYFYMFVCMYVYMSVCVYVYMSVCTYVFKCLFCVSGEHDCILVCLLMVFVAVAIPICLCIYLRV